MATLFLLRLFFDLFVSLKDHYFSSAEHPYSFNQIGKAGKAAVTAAVLWTEICFKALKHLQRKQSRSVVSL